MTSWHRAYCLLLINSSDLRLLVLESGAWIEVECPARLELAGGWSDTPPICYEMGGSVVNIGILVDGKVSTHWLVSHMYSIRTWRQRWPNLLLPETYWCPCQEDWTARNCLGHHGRQIRSSSDLIIGAIIRLQQPHILGCLIESCISLLGDCSTSKSVKPPTTTSWG